MNVAAEIVHMTADAGVSPPKCDAPRMTGDARREPQRKVPPPASVRESVLSGAARVDRRLP